MNETYVKDFQQRIHDAFPVEKWTNIPTLVAVSGGADSVALLRSMHALKLNSQEQQNVRLIVCHVDHGIRGGDSDGDAQFVEELTESLGLEFRLAKVSGGSQPELSASEETLREFRYSELTKIAAQTGARYIALGHNANDQAETILFRMLRGTGISGLTGIPRQRLANDSVTVVRPLLDETRANIVGYLEAINQNWRTDESNSDSKYCRNFLRNELIPLIEKKFPNVSNSLLRLGRQSTELTQYLDGQTEALREAIVSQDANRVEIDCECLKEQPVFLVRQFMTLLWKQQQWPRQAMTFEWWDRVSKAILGFEQIHGLEDSKQNLVLNLPGELRFEKVNQKVVISRNGIGFGN